MTFQDAKQVLAGWTSATAWALKDGIAKLEAHVTELRTGLGTVRFQRDEAERKLKDARADLDREALAARMARDERDRAVAENAKHQSECPWMHQAARDFHRAEAEAKNATYWHSQAERLEGERDVESARADHNYKQGQENLQKAAALAARLREERDEAREKGKEWMDRAVVAENRNAEIIAAGNRVLREFARADEKIAGLGGTPLAAFIIEEQARLIVDELLSAKNNPMIREAIRVQYAGRIANLEQQLREAESELKPYREGEQARLEELANLRAKASRLEGEKAAAVALQLGTGKALAEARAENLRLRNELAQEQAIELVLVDRKGFERRISMRRRDAGPEIRVPDLRPLDIRVTEDPPRYNPGYVVFRLAYGNLYKEMC